MRFVFAAITLLAACLLGYGKASAISSSELLESCQSVAGTAVIKDTQIEIPEAGLPCWYYMSALQNMSVLVDQSGVRLLGLCPPADSTVLDFVKNFVQYARKQKADDDNPAALALPGLAKSYPCRTDRN
jgi:hypothetical protein